MTLFLHNIFLVLTLLRVDVPLGCREEENRIYLNWPFFTVPPGLKNIYEEVCKMDSYGLSNFIKGAIPLDRRLTVKRDKRGIIIEKKSTPVKRFYTTEDLTPYTGISFGRAEIKKDTTIKLYMKRDYGDGLFLFVLKDKKATYARQITIVEDVKCPLKISIYTDELFQIPYRKDDYIEGEYEVLLYVLNYNKIRWIILDLEIQ